MIHLDSSVLIDALTGPKTSAMELRRLIQEGERMQISSLVLFEWRRGPRTDQEIADQEALFPASQTVPFGSAEALLAAGLYGKLKRARGREIDIAIAACAIVEDARLWTLNPADFKDVPNLKLLQVQLLRPEHIVPGAEIRCLSPEFTPDPGTQKHYF